MEASWDDDNFVPSVKPIPSNKWEGEDEEDDVKESWEDDDDEKPEEKKEEVQVAQTKSKKKSLAEKIAEKERLRQQELEKKMKESEEDDISPEERIRMQKESDLKLALETTFGGSNSSGLDKMCPTTKEEFEEFSNVFLQKVRPLAAGSPVEFAVFTENLVRNLCVSLSSVELKKVKVTIDNLVLEKQRMEKGDNKNKKKGKGKVQLKMESDNQYSAYTDDMVEYDDFM